MRVTIKWIMPFALIMMFVCSIPVFGAEKVVADQDPLLGLYIDQPEDFFKTEIGDLVVYYKLRMIDGFWVENDIEVFQFDKETGLLERRFQRTREGLPGKVTGSIPTEKLIGLVDGDVVQTQKIFISPESDVFRFEPAPTDPCVVVWHEVEGTAHLTVFNAITGDRIGEGVPPPVNGFSFSGPINYSPCNPSYVWQSWIDNAAYWFGRMGIPTVKMSNPAKSTAGAYIQSPSYGAIYEFGHGGSTSFVNHCNGGWETITATDVRNWMWSQSPKGFVFLGHCDGMCSTGSGTLSYEYRKGSYSGTTTVGYCGMSTASCSSCWSASLSWQAYMLNYMYLGYSVYTSFSYATAAYPQCSGCVRFTGDSGFVL